MIIQHRDVHLREEKVDPNRPNETKSNKDVVVVLANIGKGGWSCLVDCLVVSRKSRHNEVQHL